MKVFRVLITGSRDWVQVGLVRMELELLWSEVRHTYDRLIVVHGNCPTGADIMAKVWAHYHEDSDRITEEGHDAWWHIHGYKAGPIRNQAMVDKGADRCIAFIGPCTSKRCRKPYVHPSHGASSCADMAEAADILTIKYETWREAA